MNGAANRGGKPCANPAGKKTDHLGFGACWLHGGTSPQHTAKAAKLEQEAVMSDLVVRYDISAGLNPKDVLLEEVARAAGWVSYCDRRVAALGDDELAGMLKTSRSSGSGPEGPIDVTRWDAATNIWVQVWERARRDLAKVCVDAAKAGVEERRVQLAESQGELLAQVVATIVAGLGRSMEEPEVEAVVKSAMAEAVGAVRALPSGA